MIVFIVLIAIFSGVSIWFFRRGGVYNPEMPSTDHSILEVPIVEEPKIDYLTLFCEAIRDMEGKPGDLSYKNNNPGNVRCSPEGYLKKYGNVKCVNNFAVFETWEIGWDYLKNMVKNKAKKNPTWNFYDFFRHYAPVEDDNQPDKYAVYVAKRCKVPPTARVNDLFV